MTNKVLGELEAIIEKERKKGFNEGILEGLRVVRDIHRWYQENPKMVNPTPPETLLEWVEGSIGFLERKIKTP